MPEYTAKIDELLKHAVGFTCEDFAALCVAAADQAGMSAAGQEDLRALLPAECHKCGEIHGTDCPWANTCGECGRDDWEMARDRLCVDCDAAAKYLAKVEKQQADFESWGDYMRDMQKDGAS